MIPSAQVLDAEFDRLLDFARGAYRPAGGFWWLDAEGEPDRSRPSELWLTCRMTHVFALGALRGRDGCADLVDHGIEALRGPFRDDEHGGWFAAVGEDGPADDSKQAYAHAFVVLASSSAVAAGHRDGSGVLDEALEVLDESFRESGSVLSIDVADRTFTEVEPYRGVNALMHTVEGLLAAADVTGDGALLDRALEIARIVVDGFARENTWRIPEHFTVDWTPLLEYNRDAPADPFRPYGATIGHSWEWGRLLLQAEAACPLHGRAAPDWIRPAALRLIDDAAATFGADGEPGFVYTTDWSGEPVVHERMHWVAAEAFAASGVAHTVTGEAKYSEWAGEYWDYAERFLIDRAHGSWHHELDRRNEPQATVWEGKPDIYHALQATLLPLLPAAPALAASLSDGNLT